MAEFNVTIYFRGKGISTFFDTEVIEDAELREQLGLRQGGSGGIILSDGEEELVLTDDFPWLIEAFLTELPKALHDGNGLAIDFHYDEGGVDVALGGGTVTFDDREGTALSGPRDAVLDALNSARARFSQIMELAAA